MTNLLIDSKALELLAYPSDDIRLIQARIQELQSLGIQCILEAGNAKIRGQSVLGKGYCGLVFLAKGEETTDGPLMLALKVRRVDAAPATFEAEAAALAIANQLAIGPKLYAHSDHLIAMEYLEGPTIYQWLQTDLTPATVHQVLGDLLQQCFRLDQAGLDHGDLRCITEHVLLRGETPVMIDFSRSSRDRRPANVTTIIQGFFWGTVLPRFIAQYYPLPPKAAIVPLLRQYKHLLDQASFEELLSALRLH